MASDVVAGVRSTTRGAEPRAEWSLARVLRMLLAVILLVLGAAPLYRLLDPSETGFAGEFTASFTDIHLEFVWSGLLLLLPLAIGCAAFLPQSAEHAFARLAGRLKQVRILHWAALCAAASATLGVAFSLGVLDGQPNLIDSFAQALHARYWSEGRLAGPRHDLNGFWSIQNSLVTDRGWVSQYPPGHVAVLAAFMRLSLPWAAGPVLMGVSVFFTALAAERLLPSRPLAVRLSAGLLALSPLYVVIGASYMNHVTVAALTALAAWALLRAWQDHTMWALVAGAALGWSLMTRPLSTVAMAAALTLLIPFAAVRSVNPRRFLRILLAMAAGSLPFVALQLAYNRYFFGSPLTFGYEIAMGPRMRLGFLRDPWGNLYGVQEAIAYTSADVMALGVNLFESPLSAVLVIGAFLLMVPRLRAGERVILAWALAPVVTNFFYWHHGNFMGPRMLYEALPAWVLLFGVAATWIGGRIDPAARVGRYRPRAAVNGVLIAATTFGLLVMAPQRALSYGGSWHDVTRTPVPSVDRPALVFVHDAWTGRINMTLAANRYRLDLIETLARQNSTCRLQQLADAVAAGDAERERALLSRLDTIPRASGGFPASVEIAPGTRMRAHVGEALTPDCQRNVRADRRGILDLAPLIWRGDLPGSTVGGGPLFARDMGPERNAQLIAQHPDREAWLYTLPSADVEVPVLLPYRDGMQLLWGAP